MTTTRPYFYFDHHAATPLCDVAREAMDSLDVRARWANPSSAHGSGRIARAALDVAREQVAQATSIRSNQVVLTGGGTEACNLGVFGLGLTKRHVVTTEVEHPAVAASVRRLEEQGTRVTRLPVPAGVPFSADILETIIDDDTLMCIQAINHETGTVFPVAAYANVCRSKGALLFCDASQALGKIDLDFSSLGADAVAIASSKIGGPAGAGALLLRSDVRVDPWLAGGPQEKGRRPGSPSVLSHVGFGAACTAISGRLSKMSEVAAFRNEISSALVNGGAVENGADAPRAPTVCNVSFQGFKAAELVASLDVEGIEVAAGAACSTGVISESPVLSQMYDSANDRWRARSCVRFSFGPENLRDDLGVVRASLVRVIDRLR